MGDEPKSPPRDNTYWPLGQARQQATRSIEAVIASLAIPPDSTLEQVLARIEALADHALKADFLRSALRALHDSAKEANPGLELAKELRDKYGISDGAEARFYAALSAAQELIGE